MVVASKKRFHRTIVRSSYHESPLPTRATLCLWIGAHSITLNAPAQRAYSRAKGARDAVTTLTIQSKHYFFIPPLSPPSPFPRSFVKSFIPMHWVRMATGTSSPLRCSHRRAARFATRSFDVFRKIDGARVNNKRRVNNNRLAVS